MSGSSAEYLHSLVGEAVERIEDEGPAALEDLCLRNPQFADALRRRVGVLIDAGFLICDGIRDRAAPPERLGDFRIIRRLGQGGMGVVYLAEQLSLKREVALKLIRPEHLYFSGARKRFRREVDAVAKLQHTGIVPIYTVGEELGLPYFAMEYIKGCSLADVIDTFRAAKPAELDGRSLANAVGARLGGGGETVSNVFEGSWTEACFRIILQIADALEHAHRHGVLHRDVKPSNLMITKTGRVLLLDFGLAASRDAAKLTRPGAQIGSLHYLSPEQIRGENDAVDVATDVYGLGATLYELLTLQLPFQAANREGVMQKILEGRPAPPRKLNSTISWDAETVCLTAMDRDRARRYNSAAQFARDAANVLQFRPIEARRPGFLLRTRRFVQRKPGVAVGILLSAIIIIGGPALFGYLEHRANQRLQAEMVISQGQRLIAASEGLVGANPSLALLLALEGHKRAPGFLANNALQKALYAMREVRTLNDGADRCTDAIFSKNGRRCATACADGIARIYNSDNGALEASLRGHAGIVTSIDFSPDGSKILTTSADKTARLWNADTGTPILVYEGHEESVLRGIFVKNGAAAVTASKDGSIQLWDARSGELLRTYADLPRPAAFLESSADGTLVLAADSDGSARVWNITKDEAAKHFEASTQIRSAALSPDGETFITTSMGTSLITVWNVNDGSIRYKLGEVARPFDLRRTVGVPPETHTASIGRIEFSSDSDWFVTAGWDHTVRIWNTKDGSPVREFKGHDKIVQCATLSKDKRQLATMGHDYNICLWNVATGAKITTLIGHNDAIPLGCFSEDGTRLLTMSGEARLWKTSRPRELEQWVGHEDVINSGFFSADTDKFVTCARDGTARVFDSYTGQLLVIMPASKLRLAQAVLSSDAQFVATVGEDGICSTWNARTGEALLRFQCHPPRAQNVAYDRSGTRIVTCGDDRAVNIWNAATGALVASLTGHTQSVLRAVFSYDGKLVASASVDQTLKIWDASAGCLLYDIKTEIPRPTAVALDREGKRAALTTRGGPLKIFNISNPNEVLVINAHNDLVRSVEFSPDGELLVTSAGDRTVKLWNSRTGEQILAFEGHNSELLTASFTPDGARVASLSQDGNVVIWPIDAAAAAREAAPRKLTSAEAKLYGIDEAGARN